METNLLTEMPVDHLTHDMPDEDMHLLNPRGLCRGHNDIDVAQLLHGATAVSAQSDGCAVVTPLFQGQYDITAVSRGRDADQQVAG